MQIFNNLPLPRLPLTFPFTFVLSLVKGPQPYTFQKCVRWLALILTYRLLWKEILSLTTRGQAQGMSWHTVFDKGYLSLPFFSSWLLLFKLEPHATQSGLKFPMSLRIDPEILVLLLLPPTQRDSRCTPQHLAYVVLGWRPGLGAWEASTLLTESQLCPHFSISKDFSDIEQHNSMGDCIGLSHIHSLKVPPTLFSGFILYGMPLWNYEVHQYPGKKHRISM